uniref:B cell linker n=1 Tax=Strigops habroptila TaxID=2489341 RepID=A0A672VAL6_STRHB
MEKTKIFLNPFGENDCFLLLLQKMVHDMKKNESGIINKFKKFQNEQVALICKTGKDTWDRYAISELHNDNEEEQWSDDFDSDYENPDDHSDSEMYVVPSEENPDDSYEPPPSEQEKKKIPSAFPISRGEYADNRTSHQQLPPISKPLPSTPSPAMSRPKKPSVPSLPLPSPAGKPKVPPKPKECSDDEDNYIVPVDNDDDNYIEPTESSMSLPTKSPVNTFLKTTKSAPPTSPKPPLTSDMQGILRNMKLHFMLAKPLPSMPAQNMEHSHVHSRTRESPKLHTSSFNSTQESRFPTGPPPSPLPREKPTAAERRRGSSQELPLPPLPSEVPESANRSLGTPPHSSISSISSTVDQDAGVHSKAWYAATCDRKTAEDALYRSNKDGSFLIRKSSGQDSRQPYTLVVFYNRRVYNIPIRFIESTRQYALGREKSGEERFDSVAEIVENHQHTSLVLIDSQNNTKDCTKLKHIVRVS